MKERHVNQIEILAHRTELSADVHPTPSRDAPDEIEITVFAGDPDGLGEFLAKLGRHYVYEVATPSVVGGPNQEIADQFTVTVRDTVGFLSGV